MKKFKQAAIGVAAMVFSVSAFLFTFTTTASAATAYLPMTALGYSAYVCRIPNSQGFNVRVVISKPTNSLPTRAYLRSYSQPAEYPPFFWAETSSTAWWGNTVTVLEVYGANWYKLTLWEYDTTTGQDVYKKAWSDFVATGYTPNC